MRLATWNVGHQTRRTPLPADVAAGLGRLGADVIVLTEYVWDSTHDRFLKTLGNCGLIHWLASDHVAKQNQVLIASKYAVTPGSIECSIGLSDATRPNWLHVRTDGVDVVGFRRPMFKAVPRGIARYWDWFDGAIAPLASGPAVVLGDFNATRQDAALRRAASRGWQLVTPESGWSYKAKTGLAYAIDHALASQSFQIKSAEYVTEVEACSFAGGEKPYSDHAVLCVDLELGSPG